MVWLTEQCRGTTDSAGREGGGRGEEVDSSRMARDAQRLHVVEIAEAAADFSEEERHDPFRRV